MPVSRFGMFAGLAAAVTLPLSGPVHADAAATPVEAVAPLAAAAALRAPVAEAPAMVSKPIVQALPVPAEPAASDEDSYEVIGSGIASFYGVKFAGRRTASGTIYNPEELTAAHPSLPFGTQLQVTNTSNGESVIVTVTDRGPYHSNRIIDLSKAAARELGLISRGSGKVELAVVSHDS